MNFMTDKELEYYDNNLVHELHIEDRELFFRYAALALHSLQVLL